MFFQSRTANRLKSKRYAVKWLSKKQQREKAIVREHYRALNTKVYF